MFLKILSDSLVRRKSRKFLAMSALWIGLSLIVALLSLHLSIGDKIQQELRSFGANIKVLPLSSSIPVQVKGHFFQPSIFSDYLDEKEILKLKNIFWWNNILGLVPRLWTKAKLFDQDIVLLGVWFEHEIPVEEKELFVTGAKKVYEYWRIEGRWPKEEEPSECLIGRKLAEQFNIQIGQKIEIMTNMGAASLLVTGILVTGAQEDEAVVGSLAAIQRLGQLSGRVSEVDVSALTTPENKLAKKFHKDPQSLTPAEYERWYCTPYPGSIAAEIQDTIANSSAKVIRRISETQGVVLSRIKGLMFFLSLMTLFVCSLSLMGVFASDILERRREIVLFMAMGATRLNVVRLLITESGFIAFVGSCLAFVAGSWLALWLEKIIFGSLGHVHGVLILFTPLLGMFLALAGCLWPLLRTLNQNMTQVLHGN